MGGTDTVRHITFPEKSTIWSLFFQWKANQTEEDQTRLKGQLAELEKQCDEAKKKIHEESVDKLFKTGLWPVAVEDGRRETQRGCEFYSRVEGYSVADEHLSFCRTILMMALLWRLTNLPVMMTMRVVRFSNGDPFLKIWTGEVVIVHHRCQLKKNKILPLRGDWGSDRTTSR
jgi:hypothetical protein